MQDGSIKYLYIPHLQKERVANLPEDHDPSDPPLTPEAREKAKILVSQLHDIYGKPDIIAISPKLRCQQTAQPAVNAFGQIHKSGCPVITLNSLCQPDSGEYDPNNPRARKEDGLVIYGDESTKIQWFDWFHASRNILFTLITNCTKHALVPFSDVAPLVWVFTHSTITATARFSAQHKYSREKVHLIDAEDPDIKPALSFTESIVYGKPRGWTEDNKPNINI